MTTFVTKHFFSNSKKKPDSLSSDSYSILGCDVPAVLEMMMEDQREHAYANFGETYLKYRVLVFQWMMEVCEYFNMDPTTTYGAMAYLDRLQPNEKFSRFEWQMLAICCILIAGKYNESEEDLPDLATLEDITQQKIANETVLSYELWALKRMGWKLSVRTPMAFLSCYLAMGVTDDNDFEKKVSSSTKEEINAVLVKQTHALVALITLDPSFKCVRGSVLAASVLHIARRKLNFSIIWPEFLVKMTGYEATSMNETIRSIEKAYSASVATSTKKSPSTVDVDAKASHVIVGEVHVADTPKGDVARASPTSIATGEFGGHIEAKGGDEDHMLRIVDASHAVSAK